VKRFWKSVEVERDGEDWGISLDGRALMTPARARLLVGNDVLAQAIATEWRSLDDEIDPNSMPFTGLANAAIDRVEPDRAAFAKGLARYAEADLTCYRAEGPEALVERQTLSWDPLLVWARRRYDVEFETTVGLKHVAQPRPTVERLAHAVAVLDAFRLAALSPMVTIGGSLVAALAVLEKAITAEKAWSAVSVDESWQLERWGADADAVAALGNRRRDFLNSAGFVQLLES
jgi:chaperone required for assembly of F1-ATPase